MEVRARELEGRLLLGLVAAERGHDVLIGEFDDLLSHRQWLPPGLFHDTTLTPARYRIQHHSMLRAAGFRITSQDEEHGLTSPTIEEFVAKRYADETLAAADAAFMWGALDAEAVRRAHPERAGTVVPTGSPRADLWRPDMAGFYRGMPLPGVEPGRPFVLVATNLAPAAANRFWVQMRDMRPVSFDGPADPAELAIYERAGREHLDAGRLVMALRRIAREHPEVLIVVRPHPAEADGAWDDLIGPVDNVLVTREAEIGRWIRHAAALIHVRSTSAYEAAVAGVPVVAFPQPAGGAETPVHRIGAVARDEDDLLNFVTRALDPSSSGDIQVDAREDLGRLFSAMDGDLAADRIVDVWERLQDQDAPPVRSPRRALRLATAHRHIGAARTRLRQVGDQNVGPPKGGRFLTAHKFPPFSRTVVGPVVEAHRAALGRFSDVQVRIIGPRLLHMRRR